MTSALTTGNTVVLKPSPFTSGVGLKLAELAQHLVPPGVIQALSGDDSLGPWLTSHPIPTKVSFTGSSVTGRKVMESCSKTLKRFTLELGGKDPAIICDDVDVDDVARQVARLSFLNSGQICTAVKRIIVHERIYDQFRDSIVRHTKSFKVGEGHQEGVKIGPINNKIQYERVKDFLHDIDENQQIVLCGGRKPGDDNQGYFIEPTIVEQPSKDAKISREEPFGPVVPLFKFSSITEAIELANDTAYGLGASIWTKNLKEAEIVARQIEAGNVWINTHFDVSPRVPFAGHKDSGIEVEWGVAGLKAYCNIQAISFPKA